jgi:L-amino acid N-acyltransferase YncA
MKFRDAVIEDLGRIVEIYNSTVPLRTVTADTLLITVDSRINWFHEHTADKRPLWIIEENEKITGWISFQYFSTRPAYRYTAEISIYLAPETRGKGVGKKALTYAIGQCEQLNIKTIIGLIFAHNEPSIKLFSSFGFEQWGVLQNIAELDGVERSTVIVGKRIIK